MSWGEVKKVNSDLNVPLDERMKLLNGLIPRGIVKKSVSKTDGGSNVEMVNVSGKGFLHSVELDVSSVSNQTGAGSVSVYVDGVLLFTLSDSYVVSGDNIIHRKTSLIYDGDSYFNTDYENISIGAENKINVPIFFKESLRVVRTSSSANYYGAGTDQETVTYGLY